MQVLILGCGYTGTAFGRRMLDKGAQVFGTCRSEISANALTMQGISPIIFDAASLPALCEAAQTTDVILASIPPQDDGDSSYLALKDALMAAKPKWVGYLSTTGIYGDRQSGWAFEDDMPTPASPEAKRRVLAENQWRSAPIQAHIFRLPGIYGPGRSALEQVLAGTARRIDRPGQVFSRAHRDDIVQALMASIDQPNPGRNYNICDDRPCASEKVTVEACRLLNVPPPPLIPFEQADLSEMGRRFYSESKRVSNARIKAELGWRPQYPTYVEGLADCLAKRDTHDGPT